MSPRLGLPHSGQCPGISPGMEAGGGIICVPNVRSKIPYLSFILKVAFYRLLKSNLRRGK